MRTFAQSPRVRTAAIAAVPASRTRIGGFQPALHGAAQAVYDFGRISIHAVAPAPIQPKLMANVAGDAHEREADRVAEQVLQPDPAGDRAADVRIGSGAGPVPAGRDVDRGLADRLAAHASAGSPLPGATRGRLERRFGYDFGSVRIHADGEAAELSHLLGARAFTHGRGVYFGAGQFDPQSVRGTRLIAHELTHVVQQRGATALIQKAPPDGATTAADPDAAKIAKLKTGLKTAYGLTGVVDGDAAWTAAQLQDVTDAFKLLPSGDKAALKGVLLKRVSTLGGTTAGKFGSTQSVTGTTVVNEASIELADRAFANPAPASHLTIVHEVGHAVASLPGRTATAATNIATATSNELVDKSNADIGASNAAVAESNALVDPYNAAVAEFNAANKTTDAPRKAKAKAAFDALKRQSDAKRAETDRLRVVSDASQAKTKAAQADAAAKDAAAKALDISAAVLGTIKADVAAKEAAHGRAVSTAGATVGGLAADKKTQSDAYRTAVAETSKAIKTFADKTADQALAEDAVDTEIAAVRTQVGTRDTARKALAAAGKDNPALTALAGVELAQDAWFEAARAHSLAHQRSARVQKFVEFVDGKHIAPITSYAAKNWPQKPEEFYAEAYAMYLVKPGDLQTASQALYDWFAAKSYL